MIDNIEAGAFLVVLAIIVGIWLSLGINARRRGRIVEGALVAALSERLYAQGLCTSLWLGESGLWVVCSRTCEHTGPHVNHRTGDIDRDG